MKTFLITVVVSVVCVIYSIAADDPTLIADVAKLVPLPNKTSVPDGLVAELGRFRPGLSVTVRSDPSTGGIVVEVPVQNLGTDPEDKPSFKLEGVAADDEADTGDDSSSGWRPSHLPVDFIPDPLQVNDDGSRERNITLRTVFLPDQRYFFRSMSYPWTTIGRIDNPTGYCSGTVVGPRHVLTATHCIYRTKTQIHKWIRFTPATFDQSAPFGHAFASVAFVQRNGHDFSDPGVPIPESAYDTVVLVMDRRIGDATGWAGVRVYKNKWNSGEYWQSIGYPGDLFDGARPFLENDAVIDRSNGFGKAKVLFHRNDIYPGQSGGPTWGYFKGDPYVVGVHSAEWDNFNTDGGGRHMLKLTKRARNRFG